MSFYLYEAYDKKTGKFGIRFDFDMPEDIETIECRYKLFLLDYWSLREVKTYFNLKDTTAKKLKKAVVEYLRLNVSPRKLNKRHFFEFLNLDLSKERQTLRHILNVIERSVENEE